MLHSDRSDDVDDWADESDVDFDDYVAPPSYFDVVTDDTDRQAAASGSLSDSARAPPARRRHHSPDRAYCQRDQCRGDRHRDGDHQRLATTY